MVTTVRLSFFAITKHSLTTTSQGIRANPSVGPRGYEGGINSAILRYNGADNAEPDTVAIPSQLPMNETQLAVSFLIKIPTETTETDEHLLEAPRESRSRTFPYTFTETYPLSDLQ